MMLHRTFDQGVFDRYGVFMAEEFKMQSVASSNLAAVGYNEEQKILRVEFRSGDTYEYRKVPKKLYEELLSAESVGSFFHANIRSDFPYSKL